MSQIKNKILLTLTVLLLLSVITACSDSEDATASNENQDTEKGTKDATEKTSKEPNPFPLTMEIEGKEVILEEKPKNIAALSLNVAEVAMELIGIESIVAVTESMGNESLSHFSDKMDAIPNKITGATALDPEVVLSYDPDLVLLTLTHGSEQDADEVLENAGVPLASFNRWTTIDELKSNYNDIGELLGEQEKAKEIVQQMEDKVNAAQAIADEQDEKPSVLLLSQVGSNTGPYILGPSSIAYDLITIAGGIPASDVLELEKSTPASMEHIIDIDPDFIILVEWGETSDEFTELIESPGFQTLTAMNEDKVKQIEAKNISQANRYVVDVLDELVHWIHEE